MRMSAAHLAPQGGGYEPQRKYDWEIELYGVPGQEVIKLTAQSFKPPSVDNAAIELPYLNEVVKVAGQAKWNDAELTVRDMVDAPVYASLMEWKAMVQDPETGNHGYASLYKKQGSIVMLGPDGGTERRYQLIGVWPKTVTPENLDYSNGNAVYTVSVTLSVDKAIPQF